MFFFRRPMDANKAQDYINTLKGKLFLTEMPIKKAQEILGEKEYEKLYEAWGPAKKGGDALLAEKGSHVFIFNKVTKVAEAAQNSAKHPTYTDLENTREKKKLADVSFRVSIVLTAIFFLIGSVADFDYWILKLVLAIGAGIGIYWVYRRITRFLIKVT